MNTINKTRLGVLLALGLSTLAPAHVFAQEISDDWEFSESVYAWLPDIGGNTQFPLGDGRTIDVDVSTILNNLKMAFQGAMEVHKGRWGGFTDIVYLDVGDSQSQTHALTIGEVTLSGTVETAVDFDLKSTIWTIAGSYRTLVSRTATVDKHAHDRHCPLRAVLGLVPEHHPQRLLPNFRRVPASAFRQTLSTLGLVSP